MNYENRLSVYISSIICGSFFIFIFFASKGFSGIKSFIDIIVSVVILSIVFFIPFFVIKGFFWVKKAKNEQNKVKTNLENSEKYNNNNFTINNWNRKTIIFIVILIIVFLILFLNLNNLNNEVNFLEKKINEMEDEIQSLNETLSDIKDKINY